MTGVLLVYHESSVAIAGISVHFRQKHGHPQPQPAYLHLTLATPCHCRVRCAANHLAVWTPHEGQTLDGHNFVMWARLFDLHCQILGLGNVCYKMFSKPPRGVCRPCFVAHGSKRVQCNAPLAKLVRALDSFFLNAYSYVSYSARSTYRCVPVVKRTSQAGRHR